MENETAVNLDEPEWTPQRLRDGIDVLARHQVELEAIVKAQGELIQAQDTAIKALAKLQTSDHVRIEFLTSRSVKA
jgi:hypothetical protein